MCESMPMLAGIPGHASVPAGRTLTSDWLVNSFIIVVYEKMFFKVQSEFSVKSITKIVSSLRTIIKLFTNQSEVSTLPAGCLEPRKLLDF